MVYYYNPLWIIHNFEYDYGYTPDIQYFNVRKTVSTQKGVCYDFAHLFAAFCRCQNISCYVIDGDKRDYIQYHHTWNRVYFFRLENEVIHLLVLAMHSMLYDGIYTARVNIPSYRYKRR